MGGEGGSGSLLGPMGVVVLVAYLLTLIGIGLWGRRARRENTLADHFLAGRSLGLMVLFFTLYATQYSGNTLVGFAGNAYRRGFVMIMSVTGMMTVIALMALYAPRLQRLAQRRRYLTPADFLRDRFGSGTLALLGSLLCIWVLANYILSNLIAIGTIVQTTTGGRIPFGWGVIGLALIMVVYESLGGMRSVAWTDLIQGTILLLGVGMLCVLVVVVYDGPSHIATALRDTQPALFVPPSAQEKRTWLSTVLLLGFGISVYPHMIQRFFAASSASALKRSLQLMVFMPFVTTLLVVLLAVVGVWRFPGLDRAGSEQVLLLLINDLATHVPGLSIMLVLFVCAAVAAIMSTVDSALLSLASMFTADLYRPLRPGSSETHLTRLGKGFSWGIMALMCGLAMVVPKTIWWLIELKLAYFVQIAPAFLLGATSRRLSAGPVLAGLCVGVGITLAHTVRIQSGVPIAPKPWGFHAAVWGLAANFATIGVGWAIASRATVLQPD